MRRIWEFQVASRVTNNTKNETNEANIYSNDKRRTRAGSLALTILDRRHPQFDLWLIWAQIIAASFNLKKLFFYYLSLVWPRNEILSRWYVKYIFRLASFLITQSHANWACAAAAAALACDDTSVTERPLLASKAWRSQRSSVMFTLEQDC